MDNPTFSGHFTQLAKKLPDLEVRLSDDAVSLCEDSAHGHFSASHLTHTRRLSQAK